MEKIENELKNNYLLFMYLGNGLAREYDSYNLKKTLK